MIFIGNHTVTPWWGGGILFLLQNTDFKHKGTSGGSLTDPLWATRIEGGRKGRPHLGASPRQ